MRSPKHPRYRLCRSAHPLQTIRHRAHPSRAAQHLGGMKLFGSSRQTQARQRRILPGIANRCQRALHTHRKIDSRRARRGKQRSVQAHRALKVRAAPTVCSADSATPIAPATLLRWRADSREHTHRRNQHRHRRTTLLDTQHRQLRLVENHHGPALEANDVRRCETRAQVPSVQLCRNRSCSAETTSISIPSEASLSRAISTSITGGTT